MKLFCGITLALVLASAAAAQAPGAISATPSAHQVELARRVVSATGDEKTILAQVQSLVGQQIAATQKQFEALDRANGLSDTPTVPALPDQTVADLVHEMLEARVGVYASVYSEAELQGIVDYYSSPLGQRILAKQPQLSQAMGAAMFKIIQGHMAATTAKLISDIKAQK